MPEIASVIATLADIGVEPLVLSGQRPEDAESAKQERGIQLLIRRADVRAATAVLEPQPWRYSWIRRGLMRLVPMVDYWWDGGAFIEAYWGLPAAPLPPIALARLATALWSRAEKDPVGYWRPDVASLAVHYAVQACRPGRGHDADWRHFVNLRSQLADLSAASAIARQAGVASAFRRAVAAADAGSGPPPRGPVFDGPLGIAWWCTTAVQARLRPRRLARILAGVPSLGDAPIRCRVAGTEVVADTGVFVPTPDAEIFVDMVRKRVAGLPRPRIVEVGTGCGAIALAIANARRDGVVHAAEIDVGAVRCAQRNAERLGLHDVVVSRGSLLEPVSSELVGGVDVVIANLPFYPARNFASIGSVPRDTIQGPGDDGLDLVRQLAADARRYLRPDGWLILQMFAWQVELLTDELKRMGYVPGNPRLSGPFAIWPMDYRPGA
ncbi:MAG TPA: class I SAM-dependent methyltransferase [Candidatus Limnocylindria bacterium]|nr:class I SAM-dependent methyltransferase [Candidatus Limnocylindria bacterium]